MPASRWKARPAIRNLSQCFSSVLACRQSRTDRSSGRCSIRTQASGRAGPRARSRRAWRRAPGAMSDPADTPGEVMYLPSSTQRALPCQLTDGSCWTASEKKFLFDVATRDRETGPKLRRGETSRRNRGVCGKPAEARDASERRSAAKCRLFVSISGTGQERLVFLAERMSAEPVFSSVRPCPLMTGERPVK